MILYLAYILETPGELFTPISTRLFAKVKQSGLWVPGISVFKVPQVLIICNKAYQLLDKIIFQVVSSSED